MLPVLLRRECRSKTQAVADARRNPKLPEEGKNWRAFPAIKELKDVGIIGKSSTEISVRGTLSGI
jgi:hypothetical protein